MRKVFHIDKDISSEMLTEFSEFIDKLEREDSLTLMVNSNGGSVVSGFALYDLVKGLPNETECNIIGCAASAATYVCLACDKVVMQASSTFMIHEVSGYIGGTPREIKTDLKYMESLQDRMIAMYAEKAKYITLAQIEEMVENTTFMNAQEALNFGFVDEVPGLTRQVVQETHEEPQEVNPEEEQKKGIVNRILSIFNKPQGEVFKAPTPEEIAINEEVMNLNNQLQEKQMELDNMFKSLEAKESEFESLKNQQIAELDAVKSQYENSLKSIEDRIKSEVHNRIASLGYHPDEVPTPAIVSDPKNSSVAKFFNELGIKKI